jgi:hypothetical protein
MKRERKRKGPMGLSEAPRGAHPAPTPHPSGRCGGGGGGLAAKAEPKADSTVT